MPRFIIDTYEIYTDRYFLDAENKYEALRLFYEGVGTRQDTDHLSFVRTADECGMDLDQETVDLLSKDYPTVSIDDGRLPGIMDVFEDTTTVSGDEPVQD